ncbi:MAG: hypothetical protein Q9M89_05305 [Persephonella sp.]|nr:hypothetical protein [Persephonella sp.]
MVGLKQYMTDTPNPITVIAVNKSKPVKYIFNKLRKLENHLKIVVFVDHQHNGLNNPYMLIWRVTNNIDALKDVWIEEIWGIDATRKWEIDGYYREWPEDVFCSPEVVNSLAREDIIDIDYDLDFFRKFQIIP